MNNMTQTQVIINAIEHLAFNLKNRFTAKNLMNYLIHTSPGTHWKRGTIAHTLSVYQRDDENELSCDSSTRPRVYYATPVKQTFPVLNTDKQYSLIVEGEESIFGSLQALTRIISKLDLSLRYSQSEDKFIDYSELHVNHLENIVSKDMEGMSKAEIKSYLNTKLFKTYVSKK